MVHVFSDICLTWLTSHVQSSDSTVFFFTVGEKYNPIGFVRVPGPVQALEWSPHSHVSMSCAQISLFKYMCWNIIDLTNFCYGFTQSENRLLVLCQNGHVVEVQSPDPEARKPTKTFQLPELPCRYFRFRSIKSRVKVRTCSAIHPFYVLF